MRDYYDNLKTAQRIYDRYFHEMFKYGPTSLYQAYKKPSAAKKRAWERILEKYNDYRKYITVLTSGPQRFYAALEHGKYFIYITPFREIYYRLDGTTITERVKELI